MWSSRPINSSTCLEGDQTSYSTTFGNMTPFHKIGQKFGLQVYFSPTSGIFCPTSLKHLTLLDPPPAVFGHRGAYIPSEKVLVIFGGQTNQNGVTNRIYYFHIESETWEQIIPEGEPIIGLVFPSLAYDELSHRYLFLPTSLYESFSNLMISRLLIFGGIYSSGVSTYISPFFFEFYFSSRLIQQLDPTGPEPQGSLISSPSNPHSSSLHFN